MIGGLAPDLHVIAPEVLGAVCSPHWAGSAEDPDFGPRAGQRLLASWA